MALLWPVAFCRASSLLVPGSADVAAFKGLLWIIAHSVFQLNLQQQLIRTAESRAGCSGSAAWGQRLDFLILKVPSNQNDSVIPTAATAAAFQHSQQALTLPVDSVPRRMQR